MIGIFVDPGVLPAISDEAQSRFERIFEYDSLSDRYSRFLLEELIPAVAKQYNLSTNPDDPGDRGDEYRCGGRVYGGVESAGSVSSCVEFHWDVCCDEGRGPTAGAG